jgi:hypothetical protein
VIKLSIKRIINTLLGTMPSKRDQEAMIQGMYASARHFWILEAQKQLQSSSRAYIDGLTGEVDKTKATIVLEGALPNLIEHGFEGGDMRQWMLKGPRAKQGKNGKYVVIPFQHGSTGTGGRNVGPVMHRSIYNVAKRLEGTLSRPAVGGASSRDTEQWGERLHPGLPMSKRAHTILTTNQQRWHATSVYRNMVREEKFYKKGKQTTGYHTFRTLSENVIRGKTDKKTGRALEHWYHPGVRPYKIADQVKKHIRRTANDIIKVTLKNK